MEGDLSMSAALTSILYPTDYSELSLHAVAHARLFAERFNAQLHCVHVVDDAAQYWSTVGPESVPVGPVPDEVIALARSRMTEFVAQHLAGLPVKVTTEVRAGRPFAEIVSYAEKHGIDLIVMATHGRGAISQALMGSTAEKVVRKASCAVLTVRAPEVDPEPL